MNGVTIRPVRDGDEDLVWAMLEPVFRAGQTYAIDPAISRDEALGYWLAAHAFVAEGPEPLGTFYIQPNRPGGGAHYCNCGFVTARDAEGRGVARAMLDHALREAAQLGYEGMVFNFVVATNTRAIALWKRAGFETVGRVPGAFRAGSTDADALVMFRRLDDQASAS
jgi:ribosomal protein S18 acetylase RimI-like enzyme